MKGIYLLLALFLFFSAQCQSTTSAKKDKKTKSKSALVLPPLPKVGQPKVFPDPRAVIKDANQSIADRQAAVVQMVAEDTVGTEEYLLEVCANEPQLLIGEVINYFGEKYYHKAADLLKEMLKTSGDLQIIYSVVFALLQMELSELNNYVVNYCENANGDKRYQCLLAINDTENQSAKKTSLPMFKNIITNPKLETKKLVALAANFIKVNEKIIQTKKRDSYAIGVGVGIPKKEKKQPKNLNEHPFLVASKNKENDNTRTERLKYKFKNTRVIFNKIDRSLKQHARGNNTYAQFLIKAYQEYFSGKGKKRKLSESQARNLLKKGVYSKESLSAVIRYTKRQYRNKQLRIYALANVLRITKKEATYVIRL